MMPLPAHEKINSQRGESPSRVLIVDGEPLIRWSLAVGLRVGGFDTMAASTGAQAVALAGTFPPPDVILVDLDLFDADPAVLLADLKSIAPNSQFLLMTTGEVNAFVDGPETRVIRKPFDLGDVVRLVRSLMDVKVTHYAPSPAGKTAGKSFTNCKKSRK
jgi:DNA-binding response OmpR family regulator